MYIALLGRQPQISIAELEQVCGSDKVAWFSDTSALVQTDELDITRLGGSLKAGRVIAELSGDWQKVSRAIVRHYEQQYTGHEGKLTLGISAYGFPVSGREVQKTGIILKQTLKKRDVSVRLIPNSDAALSTATAHHNKLGLAANKLELLVVKASGNKVVVAESTGSQNITALAKRDQERPKRDAFVGMLPPKLAQIMINLAAVDVRHSPIILDPFCGTGVVLQEAALLGYSVYGTDLSEKMIRYSRDNLNWLKTSHALHFNWYLHEGDAMTAQWRPPIDGVVAETYLGQPFSAPPSPAKLAEVRRNCDHIISTFLENIATQLEPGTPLCLAVPAWRDTSGRLSHLPLTGKLNALGFKHVELKNVKSSELIYYREDQVVARELLLLTRI